MRPPCKTSHVTSSFAAVALCLSLMLPAGASAAPAKVGKGTQLIMLGTAGGPLIRAARAEPSTLLIVDGTPYLIDCGVGALRRMVEAGIRPQSLRAIFITHHHPDHDLDLANIMASDFFGIGWGQKRSHWNIYGPPGTRRMVAAAIRYISVPFDTFAAEGVTSWDIKSHFTGHNIAKPGLVYQDDKIRVTAVENTHFATMPAKYRAHMKSYSYRIRTPHGTIVFTGDTGPSKAVAKLAKGADVLVSEVLNEKLVLSGINRMAAANHWSAERKAVLVDHMKREHLAPAAVARLARAAGVRTVLLHHLVPGTGSGDAEDDVKGVKAGFDGQVIAAHDLAHYCVNAQTDAGKALSSCDGK